MSVQPNPEQIELHAHAAWEQGQLAEAQHLFERAARAGSRNCMLALGYFLECGLVDDPDRDSALRWYRRAYRLGDFAAASNIAVMYAEDGKHRQSFAWYQRAAALGDTDAHLELAMLLIDGRGVRASLTRARAHAQAVLDADNATPHAREQAAQIATQLDALP